MPAFSVGDRVQVDIGESADPAFDAYHGRIGEITEILARDSGEPASGDRDAAPVVVAFANGGRVQLQWSDLRVAPSE